MYKLFIVFNNHQALACSRIIKNSLDKNNIFIVSTIDSKSLFYEHKYIQLKSFNKIPDLIKEISTQDRKRALNNIIPNVDSERKLKNIDIFIPHFYHLVTNYLVNYLFINRINSLNIIPDGVLNYYHYEQNSSLKLNQFIKKITAKLIGIDYKMFFSKNIVNPFNLDIDYIYSYCPELTINNGAQIKEIFYPRLALSPNANNILILGTDFNNEYDDLVCSSIVKLINKLPESNIFYKKHPTVDSDRCIKIIRNELENRKIIEISSKNKIHDVIELQKIKFIFSIGFSTANIEIQQEYSNSLISFVHGPMDPIYKESFQKIKSHFSLQDYPKE
jgi:hypothetical protein